MSLKERLQTKNLTQPLGFSLEEIRQILDVRDRGEPPCSLVQDLLHHKIEHLEAQIKQMMAFKFELEAYRDRWAHVPNFRQEDHEICPLIATVLPSSDVAQRLLP
ncbi:MAG: MerR family DNA-binding protein [Leptolyngbyaceae bacterium]|nr:MerR family DNA-binding protein [Leptolyngbyaceae bacterium]